MISAISCISQCPAPDPPANHGFRRVGTILTRDYESLRGVLANVAVHSYYAAEVPIKACNGNWEVTAHIPIQFAVGSG